MKRTLQIKIMFFVLLTAIMSGCKKDDFRLQFDLSENVTSNYRLLYIMPDEGDFSIHESTAVVNHGKCEMTLPLRRATIVWIMRSSDQSPSTLFFAEPGNRVVFTGESADPALWDISGNKINEEMAKWRVQYRDTLSSQRGANYAVREYVVAHLDNPVSALLLLTQYSRKENPAGYDSLWNMLSDKACDNGIIESLQRTDQMSDVLFTAEEIESFPIYVKGDSMININPHDRRATLICFRDNSEPAKRRAVNDSLRRLLKMRMDTLGGAVVDISMDRDSTTWLFVRERDSLDADFSGWMPAGAMNAMVQQFNIPSVPMYYVVDSGGRILYSGVDYGRAKRAYLKAMER